MNAEDERKATEELADLTKMGISPLVWLAIYSMSFVCGSSVDAMQEWNYSVQECLIATAFASFVGIIISQALEPKYWIGFTHFAGFAYLLALLCSIPFLQELLSSIQVLLFLSSILFASAAYSLHRRYS